MSEDAAAPVSQAIDRTFYVREPRACTDDCGAEWLGQQCAVFEPVLNLGGHENSKPVLAEQAAINQRRWEEIGKGGPCTGTTPAFEHPSIGCSSCGLHGSWFPELFCTFFDPACSIGQTVSIGRGEPHLCAGTALAPLHNMGIQGWTACLVLQCCQGPCLMGGLTYQARLQIIRRYGLRPETGFNDKGLTCDHPVAICCCYSFALWKHEVLAKTLEHDAKYMEAVPIETDPLNK